MPRPSEVTVTAPARSVRHTWVPRSRSRLSTSGAGCAGSPDWHEMMATDGAMACRKGQLDERSLPWCGTCSTSADSVARRLSSSLSTSAPMSAGSSIDTRRWVSRSTMERSLSSKASSLGVPVGHSTSARASAPRLIVPPAAAFTMGTPAAAAAAFTEA